MFSVSLCEPSKGTLRCYTSICDGIISIKPDKLVLHFSLTKVNFVGFFSNCEWINSLLCFATLEHGLCVHVLSLNFPECQIPKSSERTFIQIWKKKKRNKDGNVFYEVYQYFQWEDMIGWMLRLNQSMKATYMKYVLLRWKAAQYLHQRQTDKTFCCLFKALFPAKLLTIQSNIWSNDSAPP